MIEKMPVNFLYLGGDKCGSTWLWHILDKHPDVTLARAKELFYFDRFYGKGQNWYLRQFPNRPNTSRVGEICHDYLYSEDALKRIASDMPYDSVFLITVREPVARSVSHWKYAKKVGATRLSFEEAINEDPKIVYNSLFGMHVSRAFDILGEDRVKVLDFENLMLDPYDFGRRVSEFLGVRFYAELPYTDRILEAKASRSPLLVSGLRSTGWALRHLGLPHVVSAVKSNTLVSKVLYSSKASSETVSDDLRDRLRETFRDDQHLLRSIRS